MLLPDIQALLLEAKDAYGSANAEWLGSLVMRMSAALVAQQAACGAELAQLREEVAALRADKVKQDSELAFLRTQLFGSKSERSCNQDAFVAAQAPEAAVAVAEDEPLGDAVAPGDSSASADESREAPANGDATGASGGRKKRPPASRAARRRARRAMRGGGKKSKKLSLAPEIQREEVDHPLPKDFDVWCTECRHPVRDRGVADTAREIDLGPSQVVERTHRLHEGRCLCGALRFSMPGPVRGVDKTIFSPRFVAQVIVDKFVSHLPCYRQAKRFSLEGVTIDYRRLNVLVVLGWLALEPLVKRLRQLNQQQLYQAVDESPIRVVIDGEKERRYLWCLTTKLAASFVTTATRNKEVAREVVGGRLGTLTSDRLSIYRNLFEGKGDSGCMAHCRRYFWYALPTAEPEALAAIEKIKELYAVEEAAKAQGLSAEARRKLRLTKSVPVLADLKAMIKSFTALPRSPLGRAIKYALAHWEALTYFTKDGAVEIDNNCTEAELRDPKLGFKNFLFAQSEDGLEALAGHYTLVRTAAMYGLNPLSYLVDVLSKLNSGWPKARLDELLPWNWKPPNAGAEPGKPIAIKVQHAAVDVLAVARVRARLAPRPGVTHATASN